MTIKKINATKNSNAGAINVAPKRQLLVQKRHTAYSSLRSSVHLCILHSSPFYPTSNPMLYSVFHSARHPKSALLLGVSTVHSM